MVNIAITLESESCHALAERAEENGFADVSLRQAIEIFLDSVATEIINASYESNL